LLQKLQKVTKFVLAFGGLVGFERKAAGLDNSP